MARHRKHIYVQLGSESLPTNRTSDKTLAWAEAWVGHFVRAHLAAGSDVVVDTPLWRGRLSGPVLALTLQGQTSILPPVSSLQSSPPPDIHLQASDEA